jgi:hypothetical protein
MRDLLNLGGYPEIGALPEGEARATEKQIKETLYQVVETLVTRWGELPWLVTITTSKRLRYTAPGDTPLSLWAALTWMAPAQLFVFINRVVSQTPHVRALQLAPTGSGKKATPHGIAAAPPNGGTDSIVLEKRALPDKIGTENGHDFLSKFWLRFPWIRVLRPGWPGVARRGS